MLYWHQKGEITVQLLVTRHGETDFNCQNRYAGSTDVPLNAQGREQAVALAEKLAEEHFDIVVTSPLIRARKTAEIVLQGRNIPLIFNENFRERNMGAFEGLTRAEAKAQHPDAWAHMATRSPDTAPPDGESVRDFDARVAQGLAQLGAAYGERQVLLVCHGFVSRVINRQLTGLTFESMHSFLLENCQVAVYTL